MAGKLTDKDMDQLEQWIGLGPKTFTLLYAVSRDGCNSTTFHQQCDNQGPTVTVLYNQQGSVYGGYTAANWQNTGGYVNDTTAFLFQLRYSNNPKITKFPIKNNGFAIYTAAGPTFGAGHDMFTFNGAINHNGTYFPLNGSMNIGNSYNNQGLNANQINNGNMYVTELEVYKVAAGARKKVVQKPWRMIKGWNEKFLDELTEDIIAFSPETFSKLNEARLIMIGPVGAGKSSFFNTINSIFRGRITQKANCGSADQSLTTQYAPYTVRVRSGATLNFRLCDTRGLEENQGLDVLECNYLLDGHIPDYYQFNPAASITPDTEGFIKHPGADDKVHCVVFVVDATTLEVLPSKIIQKLKSFQTLMNQKGIPQVLLLTKIDRLCSSVESDVSQVFKSETVQKHVEKASQLLGLPRGNVLPAKNYENEAQLENSTSILALVALRQILNFSEDYIESIMERMAVRQRKKETTNFKK